jgi:membrane-bound serine protease (ClpP class)
VEFAVSLLQLYAKGIAMKPIFALSLSFLSYLSLLMPLAAQDQPAQLDPAVSPTAPQLEEKKTPEIKPEEKSDKAQDKPQKRVFGKSDEASFKGKVVIIKVGEDDLVNKHAFKFWRRVIKRVNEENARAVVFDLDTPGGLAFDTAELIMVDMQKLKVPSYAFVNQKALSAGALVASGTDGIYMHPVSAIGAAAIVSGSGAEIPDIMRAKIESAFNAFVRAVAKSKNRNPDVIRAMMITKEYYDFGEIQVEEGELLTLTADEAIMEFEGKPLLAKGIVNSIDELLAREGLGDVEVVVAELSGMEKFAYWVATFSGILILVGMGGAYLEMKTPGFGIGGGISLLAFALFFFGNYAAGNMAGYGLMLLFVLGVILIVVELVILPGMIVPGVIGAILVLGTLLMAMVDGFAFEDNDVRGWDAEGAMDFINGPSLNLAIGLFGSAILMIVMMRYLPNVPLFNKMVMSGELPKGDASGEDGPSGGTGEHVGLRGVTTTALRPAGKGEFNGRVLDITAANGFIEIEKPVVVVDEDGLRILVEEEGTFD